MVLGSHVVFPLETAADRLCQTTRIALHRCRTRVASPRNPIHLGMCNIVRGYINAGLDDPPLTILKAGDVLVAYSSIASLSLTRQVR